MSESSINGRQAELNDEVAGEILGLDLAALFPPEPEDGGFISGPGVRLRTGRK